MSLTKQEIPPAERPKNSLTLNPRYLNPGDIVFCALHTAEICSGVKIELEIDKNDITVVKDVYTSISASYFITEDVLFCICYFHEYDIIRTIENLNRASWNIPQLRRSAALPNVKVMPKPTLLTVVERPQIYEEPREYVNSRYFMGNYGVKEKDKARGDCERLIYKMLTVERGPVYINCSIGLGFDKASTNQLTVIRQEND